MTPEPSDPVNYVATETHAALLSRRAWRLRRPPLQLIIRQTAKENIGPANIHAFSIQIASRSIRCKRGSALPK